MWLIYAFFFAWPSRADQKCYTLAQVKNEVCYSLCRQDGYELGTFQKTCICANAVEFRDLTSRITIAKGPPKFEKPIIVYDDNFNVTFK